MPLGSFYSLNSELLFLESYNSGLGMDPKSHWGCLLLVRKSLPEHLPPCSWRPGPHISIISASPSPLASTVSQWPNSAYSSPLPWPLPSPRLLPGSGLPHLLTCVPSWLFLAHHVPHSYPMHLPHTHGAERREGRGGRWQSGVGSLRAVWEPNIVTV